MNTTTKATPKSSTRAPRASHAAPAQNTKALPAYANRRVETLETFTWKLIDLMLNNSQHKRFIEEWRDEAAGVFTRLMRSENLKGLYARGERAQASFLIVSAVKRARLNALRARSSKQKQLTSSLDALLESFNPTALKSITLHGNAANDGYVPACMSHICHLAADPERMRYEMNMNPLIMELLLKLPILNRRVFFLKAFTDKKSRQIGHFLGLNEAQVNAIYYHVRHSMRNQINDFIESNQELINEYRHLLPA